ncbi:aminotransferase class III-fold pyridoxal phosphate-dependent enzyme [Pontibacter sp. G13]|uniref:aspartate aminotransferase family protein n=1 Tax=Pontibacter sp. G13 TaxID=3074898 RepID=UPI00288A4B5F|nr:aminotransferase class III-fold pyridoxal phosphate-dependent enzyme [Pontibacter sp. G13]WNJ16352.1 aminotransferase class III-fold pyridoxal phosphate-dependent enzyme [Pontibacter sp. G13]
MNLFDVYPLFDVEPVRAQGSYLWDKQGNIYLDLYGGHAVISIGHSHPAYVRALSLQLNKLGFYSNSVKNSLQVELAKKLGELSGYKDHQLFLCNSGAEAIENALKLASFHTKRSQVLALSKAFHGRTSAAVAITDNPKIQAPVNATDQMTTIPFNDLDALEAELSKGTYAAFVVEGIQGVAGIKVPSESFLRKARRLCTEHGTVLILDEIQSGYGRTGKFFAHQHAGIEADLITVAKGMGNGFPIGGVLIGPQFEPWHGMLGTTFGGNHLACAAGIAVLDVLKEENLMKNASKMGQYLVPKLEQIPGIKSITGKGLMIGMELDRPAKEVRKALLSEYGIFTGSASDPHVLRLLPSLGVEKEELKQFLQALENVLTQSPKTVA